jgi:apolipoprotein N-acyltransferase
MSSAPTTAPRSGLGRIDNPTFAALAVAGLIGIAWIHLLDLGEKMDETPYLGLAYLGVIAGCAASAVLLARRNYFGFVVGGRLAAAIFIGYNFSRTIGFPGATGDINNWWEPLGVLSLIAEGAVVAVSATALTMARSRARRLRTAAPPA